MNDEPTSDALSRASAYLDGELDATEIAAAEAEPAIMAEVALLRSLQAELRDVPGPSSQARDTALAAALAEFDTVRRPAVARRDARRPSYARWMAVAAAIAGVALLGAVITTAGRGDDGGGDAAQSTVAEQSAVAFDANTAEQSVAGGAPAPPQPATAQSETMLATEATEAPAAAGAGDRAPAADPSQESAATTAATATSLAQFDPTTPIADELELRRIARELLSAWQSGARDEQRGTGCDGAVPDVVLLSDGLLIVDGADRAVLIAANPHTGDTFALDRGTCAVIMAGR